MERSTAAMPMLSLQGIERDFASGDGVTTVLQDINVDIQRGEMVAIIGQSGSGKSTLMNILGCLDRPSRGQYWINGQNSAEMDEDELARLRREYFGFVFQRYNLLGDLSAQQNVETPAIYSNSPAEQRASRAQHLMQRLGLGHRLDYRPSQLSGGQQQRVSIARALMNGGQVILADEPTGALDSKSGIEVMRILRELHQEGHTVILVTHEHSVAAQAERVIEIKDGRIIADYSQTQPPIAESDSTDSQMAEKAPLAVHKDDGAGNNLARFQEALKMALRAMSAHKLRTFLTMLGIIIGIASVVSVVALGEGSRQQVLANISSMGTNTIEIMSGRGFGDRRMERIQTLVPADADALAQLPFVDSVTPRASNSTKLRYRNKDLTASVEGVGENYFRVKGLKLMEGKIFSADSVKRHSVEGVIDYKTRRELFGETEQAIGKVVLAGNLPIEIVGVLEDEASMFGQSTTLTIYMPYTTVMHRVLGQNYLRNITVRLKDDVASVNAEQGIKRLLTKRHGSEDFNLMNTDSIRQTIENTTKTMTLLISSIAVISLIVGGIGVMNIMLVSVTERTREIGIRMAVGARQSDIMQQFLIEAVLVCLVGGLLGIALSLAIGWFFAQAVSNFTMVFSSTSIVAAFLCSTAIGIIFGFMPARNAAKLDPVQALSGD